jgi:hypothetical protein
VLELTAGVTDDAIVMLLGSRLTCAMTPCHWRKSRRPASRSSRAPGSQSAARQRR